MGYVMSKASFDDILQVWSEDYRVFAPKLFEGAGSFSDTDRIRYGAVHRLFEIVFHQKSEYSFKEVLLPISQSLFFYTEQAVKEAEAPKAGAIVFLRSCDLHALKRMDDIYLRNGYEDYYYRRLRERTKFILMGCEQSFDNCFCVAMQTNTTDAYDAYIKVIEDQVFIDNHNPAWISLFDERAFRKQEVVPDVVSDNKVRFNLPNHLSLEIRNSKMWEEYDSRCIACGRCNFVCPTCTCFTMQDIFYTDNEKAGERRRVWASCQVDGFTDLAGGHRFRAQHGQRMRFKVLHKVYDYKKRWGYHMCVGCGRCDDICPEYISFFHCLNKLDAAMEEVK